MVKQYKWVVGYLPQHGFERDDDNSSLLDVTYIIIHILYVEYIEQHDTLDRSVELAFIALYTFFDAFIEATMVMVGNTRTDTPYE